MDIALAKKSDLESLMSLYRSYFDDPLCTWNENYPTQELVLGDIERGDLFCMKNEVGDIIAALSIDLDPDVESLSCWTNPDTREIARVAVWDEYRGRGLAGEMVSYVMEELKRRGNSGIKLLVAKSNFRAINAYSRFSFETVGECNMFGHDFWCYEKIFF